MERCVVTKDGCSAWPLELIRGMVFAAWTPHGYGTPEAAESLEQLAGTGATEVAVVVTAYLEHSRASEVRAHPNRTPTEESVIVFCERALELGLDIVLKPHVDVVGGHYRGLIEPEDPRRWFETYQAFLVRWATLGARLGCRSYWVGTELETMTRHPDHWASMLEEVRQVFPGPLVYAANFVDLELEATVKVGSLADFVGVDAYFPLSEQPDPDFDVLLAGWKPWIEMIEAFSRATERPVLITEIGCPSRRNAALAPWDFESSEPIDLDLQARYYEAALRALPTCAALRGMYFWSWGISEGGVEDGSMTPRGKPAESVLRRFWAM